MLKDSLDHKGGVMKTFFLFFPVVFLGAVAGLVILTILTAVFSPIENLAIYFLIMVISALIASFLVGAIVAIIDR